ncbi:UDP-N-acetylglucosamine 2-epimerase (non-hydrolyzing) [Limosilactobacillus sp. STM2_1]|uniref:UDP-N-acetylglucosamine 2-epimerase (non-hydrolyzing) n=1 Tax=Limosilactobacillus rudii TaxID=2759755 RepID=A0A7W3UMT0_9LACO|nr:UDP-N-acetylglucosamine 2-epimerase (non-hydrolyzing) [Limosilactobacillus rudii]MBB1080413.1 UDP-N-acetylglucosamine 2-epimerase (non-hydrolyzing) [Limosilactobacillus rudii]MBB1098439.1 UDP-N-acetylglucosamine 2-epimerase (non-hydrolyzing) [Limosilactobacillus rudii]MCD7135447.1 UDP-N-acetylglucosamine 2-epimerase (non-hydrolyzing) [Limosilactobacillus rudii]
MKKIKVMSVFGTRPEGIKMGPVVKALADDDRFTSVVVSTGQHAEMLQQVLDVFAVKPDYDLKIMKPGQTLTGITVTTMTKLEPIIQKEHPDIMLVHGDTSSAYAAALTAFYNQVAIGHVEAGLRTWNKYSPYPEEMNRQMIDDLADLYFAPTKTSAHNLALGNHQQGVVITGNTAIDALHYTINQDYQHSVLDEIDSEHKIILLTMHRRENWGQPMEETFKAIKKVVDERENIDVIYPVHLNPKVQMVAKKILGGDNHFHLIAPLNVVDFHNLMSKALLVMSDSGGVQEEAPALHKPVLVLRDTTERPEGVSAGTLKLIGNQYENVVEELSTLLDSEDEYQKMSEAKNPYGDGRASKRILDAIAKWFEQK